MSTAGTRAAARRPVSSSRPSRPLTPWAWPKWLTASSRPAVRGMRARECRTAACTGRAPPGPGKPKACRRCRGIPWAAGRSSRSRFSPGTTSRGISRCCCACAGPEGTRSCAGCDSRWRTRPLEDRFPASPTAATRRPRPCRWSGWPRSSPARRSRFPLSGAPRTRSPGSSATSMAS